MGKVVVAVDVGTGSARAGLYDSRGTLLERASHPILVNRQGPVFATHSSSDIWQAVCTAVRTVMARANVGADEVAGIGFDATCSLVVLDADYASLPVCRDGKDPAWDTIAWFDHRAIGEAETMTATADPALRFAGEIVSPEMQLPKLLWLKRHRPELWAQAHHIFDLADYLTFRATGLTTRALSTLATKWNYLAHESEGWSERFLNAVDLADIRKRTGIRTEQALAPGAAVGALGIGAAADLDLPAGIVVATGMVDAYAGLLSLLAGADDVTNRAALIGGTSSCVMCLMPEAQFLRSFWGPYFGAVLGDSWVLEGGQSATGALLDLIIQSHGAGGSPTAALHQKVLDRISERLSLEGPDFAGPLHILPDHHGNRSPFGDAMAGGAIQGLSLDPSFDGLCTIYYRAMVSLALGIRQILDLMELTEAIRRLEFGGGHVLNPILTRLYADVTGREISIGAGDEAMLHGTAIAAATAAGVFPSLPEGARAMRRQERVIAPETSNRACHERDYRVFLKMQEQRRELARIL